MTASTATRQPPTRILKHQPYSTQINFFHTLKTDQQRISQDLIT